MEKILYEFPIKELKIHLPKWIETLPQAHCLKQSMISSVKSILSEGTNRLRELKNSVSIFEDNKYIKKSVHSIV
ncbi:MAG: stage IV sporulation protein A [Defluviitaleaceae bacterium]|nr:stage IV sporulation protein A [Defluviitaleaceae bacterium]